MSKNFTRRATTAALTVFAITALSPVAHAEEEPAGLVTAAYATAPCDRSGTTSEDAALATRLNGTLTAKMRGYLTAYRMSCARMVVDAVRDRGLSQRAAAIAIATVIVETSLQNISEEVDHDSLGLFQQRASWGSAANRLNPVWATNAFLDKMVRVYPNGSWSTAPIGEVCQAVQVSAYPDRYQTEAGDAQKIVSALWQRSVADGADFDGNGAGDIYATGTGTLTIWNGKGNNNFTAADAVGGGWEGFTRPAAGDFNKDGKTDLAAVKNGTLYVWNGKGGNKFGAADAVGSGWEPFTAPVAGDFNNDGISDLSAVKDGTLYIWNGKGANHFTPADTIGGGWEPFTAPIAGDFNNDGKTDLAAVRDDSTLYIWNGKGSNKFGEADAIGGGWGDYHATLMSLGDVDQDGHTDIGAVSKTSGTLYLWNGKGANRFGAADALGGGWLPHF
ncbi:VCBS repeat-containing protein [Amycolatopsis sp. EV170708-02-1]|uniref:FG-GAP repeat domain-containing protein n=1 Tax=Amycolatopsis sp. EV170708-02-1 TaxID=2919322 RepID=UPI001F0C5EA4|nr:VCBS repeat-containing protein [Amycolatopsis sp. EV170708-02-1]UMP04362.1 VCBS repeat-containing protein [Amycolatopsis sp. EV170708-02-1]